MRKYFGTDGFRGKANEGLTASHAYEIGRFLGWYYGRHSKAQIVVGKDTRRSCYMLEYAISAGMAASGADVYLLHVTTTPSVSYVTRTDGFDCGVMISASHNPYEYNGIKVFGRDGYKLSDELEERIEALVDQKQSYEVCSPIGNKEKMPQGVQEYVDYLYSSFGVEGRCGDETFMMPKPRSLIPPKEPLVWLSVFATIEV